MRAKRAGWSYPTPFASDEQVEEYLSGVDAGAKLMCLLCGKCYANLGRHVSSGHGMPPADYRQHFGIPQGRGLVSPGLHGRLVRRSLDQAAMREAISPGYHARTTAMGRAVKATLAQTQRPLAPATLARLREQARSWGSPASQSDIAACCVCGARLVTNKLMKYRHSSGMYCKRCWKEVRQPEHRELRRERAARKRREQAIRARLAALACGSEALGIGEERYAELVDEVVRVIGAAATVNE